MCRIDRLVFGVLVHVPFSCFRSMHSAVTLKKVKGIVYPKMKRNVISGRSRDSSLHQLITSTYRNTTPMISAWFCSVLLLLLLIHDRLHGCAGSFWPRTEPYRQTKLYAKCLSLTIVVLAEMKILSLFTLCHVALSLYDFFFPWKWMGADRMRIQVLNK